MPVTVCPNCSNPMNEVSRRGVFVDVCPNCRGVWLDGGELEKLLTAADAEAQTAPQEPRYRSRDDYRKAHPEFYDEDHRGRRDSKRRKKSGVFEMFGDLFD